METEIGYHNYILMRSRFGDFSVVWRDTDDGPKVFKVILPRQGHVTNDLVRTSFQDAVQGTCPEMSELGDKMQAFLEGEPVGFELGTIARGLCSRFQKRVLFAEYKIPRGWVSTYGRLANYIRIPKSVRAVGNALANNPFPIIIPCHRTICAR